VRTTVRVPAPFVVPALFFIPTRAACPVGPGGVMGSLRTGLMRRPSWNSTRATRVWRNAFIAGVVGPEILEGGEVPLEGAPLPGQLLADPVKVGFDGRAPLFRLGNRSAGGLLEDAGVAVEGDDAVDDGGVDGLVLNRGREQAPESPAAGQGSAP
jgi:hypothetical protein